LDLDTVASCFDDPVEVAFPGWQSPRTMTPVAWSERCLQLLRGFDASQHFLGNHYVDLRGPDDAHVVTYLRAMHYLADPETPSYEVGGRYEHQLRRTSEGWKISRWGFQIAWEQGDPGAFRVALARPPRA